MITTEQQEREQAAAAAEQFRRHMEEAAEKDRRLREFVERTTCPHCGRHDPLPPWLQG